MPVLRVIYTQIIPISMGQLAPLDVNLASSLTMRLLGVTNAHQTALLVKDHLVNALVVMSCRLTSCFTMAGASLHAPLDSLTS
jgi:hypothetical protein